MTRYGVFSNLSRHDISVMGSTLKICFLIRLHFVKGIIILLLCMTNLIFVTQKLSYV